jgi:Icc protein
MNTDNAVSDAIVLPIDDVVRVLQISDTHLGVNVGDDLLGIDTDQSLKDVLTLVVQDNRAQHLTLVTGDIAADGDLEAYQRLEDYLDRYVGNSGAPTLWLPGNHDGPDGLAQYKNRFQRTVEAGAWLVVLLHSQQPGQVGGYLSDSELQWLDDVVDRANEEHKHVLVALHHPLHPVGCDWLDGQRVLNAEQFCASISRCTGSAVVISGHVHQATDQVLDGIRYLTTPSTCVQFAPNQVEFKVDQVGPGYRWLDLLPDGQVMTGISRLSADLYIADTKRQGYQ